MIRLILLLTAVSLWSLGSATGESHLFTSADGSKTLEATLIDYDATRGTVQLRLSGGRAIVSHLDAFSDKDIEYVKQASQRLAIARSLMVDIRINAGKEVDTDTRTAKVEKRNSGFSMRFRNNGFVPLDGISAKYRIYYHQDLKEGGKARKIREGSIQLSPLGPNDTEEHKTKNVKLVTIKPKEVYVGEGPHGSLTEVVESPRSDKVEGVIVVVMKGGEPMKEIKYPRSLPMEWNQFAK